MKKQDSLSTHDFQRHFSDAYQSRLQELIILQEVGSTNDFLFTLDPPENSSGIACMAELQSAGKGTKGREWQTELGASFIYSFAYSFDQGLSGLSALSLAIGVVIQQSLEECGYFNVRLKWPNDLQYQSKKLGGVLVEVKPVGKKLHLVCGIGINIKSTLNAEKIDQAFTALDEINSEHVSRNKIAAKLTEGLLNLFSLYPKTKFRAWQQQWTDLHANQNKNIRVVQGDKVSSGIARGVDEHGALLLETDLGVQKIISADVLTV